MAKVQNPVIGRAKGSAGGMTFNKVYNKNVMKAKIFEASNPNTAAQQVQRSYFKEVSALASFFTPDMLRSLFPSKPKGISRRNAAFKQLAEYTQMVEGVKEPKLSDMLSFGNAPTMDMGTTTCSISSGTVSVGLDAAVKANTAVKDFYFVALLVNDTQNDIYMDATSNKVETGTLSVTAPDSWEDTDTIHAIALITDSKAVVGGFGTLAVIKRPNTK